MTPGLEVPSWPPTLWLVVMCLPLLALLLVLACIPTRRRPEGKFLLGNPLLKDGGRPAPVPPTPYPLAHLSRTMSAPGLIDLVIGLRHLPVQRVAPILRQHEKSPNPELQLHAQAVLQSGQAALTGAFQRMEQQSIPGGNPATLASFLESGLALLASPLTPASEHPVLLARMWEKLGPALPDIQHPRALASSIRCLLRLRRPADAQTLLARLPQGSPLHTTLSRELAHQIPILTFGNHRPLTS